MTINEEKSQIRKHANRNITFLLDRLKISYYDRGDGLIQSACQCKQHGGDRSNETAWSWRRDLGKWICWSHHCEENRGNDIFGLVSSVEGLNFDETLRWIKTALQEKNIDTSDHVEDVQHKPELHIHQPLSENNLKFLTPDPQYLLNRGFDIDILRKYEVGLWSRPGTYMHNRVVFPVRDHEGFLVGYTGRTIFPKSYFDKRELKYAKWIHGRHYNQWPQRGDLFTSSILYNLNNAKRYLNLSKRIILVEGPLDGMKLEEAGIHNWVATLGTSFCYNHRTLLLQHGVLSLHVAFDNDDEDRYTDGNNPGERGWQRLERVVGDIFETSRIELPSGKDCGDLEVDQLQEIFRGVSC